MRFDSPQIERAPASSLLKSLIGYLHDCAVAILRSANLIDVTDTKDVDFLPLDPDALSHLAENDGLELEGKKVFDMLYKVTSRPNEFELLLGTLFLKGTKQKQQNKKFKINAPLLYVKLEGAKTPENKVVFSIKEDTVSLNQSLISAVVDVKDEDELEVRFQDLYDAIPTWPLSVKNLNYFLNNLSNYFPGITDENPVIEDFVRFDSVEAENESLQLCPVHCIIVTPKQEAEGTVVEELSSMLKNLLDKTAADTIFTEPIEQNAQIVSEIQDKTRESFSKEPEEEWHNLFPIDLSDTQRKIVLAARRNNLTVVSGPPGTGKSYTIAAVIIDHLLQGRRVLFVSRMEKAVEVVVNWLEEFVGDYAVARSGGRKAQRNLAGKLERLTGPNSPVRLVERKKIDEILERYVKIQGKIKDIENVFTSTLINEREWSIAKLEIDGIKKQIATDRDFKELLVDLGKTRKIKEKIIGAAALIKNKTFFLQTWWGELTLNRIKRKLNLPETVPIEELVNIAKKLENEMKTKELEIEFSKFDEVDTTWQQIQQLNHELRNLAFDALRRTLLGNLYLITHNPQKRIELRNFMKSLYSANVRQKLALRAKVTTDTLLSSFPCWASTTYHLSEILQLGPGMFDLVIFDEASQCDLASATPALYRANRALIVGDPKQLTHVVFLGKQAEFAAFANNDVSLEAQATFRFTTRSLFDVAEDRVQQENYYMLDEHFRSDPHIISFSNKKFYEEKLRIMTHRPISQNNAVAIQVDYVGGKRTEGTVNPTEIERVFLHVNELIALSQDSNPTTIGILCPFRDQVDAITKELPKYLTLEQLTKHKIVIGTAHSLQGDEKDTVILSLSLDPTYHHGTLQFLEKPNVFNVSITRAKKKLIVISSVTKKDLPNGLLKDFLLHAETSLDETLPVDKFDSKFEQEVAQHLQSLGYKVWPQYEAAGFYIDLVVGNGNDFIAVECDGPSHFDLRDRHNFYDVWRQKILERAGWRFARISYREWERNQKACLDKINRLIVRK